MDDFCQALGSHLGYSEWHLVTQDQIDLFARATGDSQWIHVDPERAAGGPFGTTIAHGYLTLSLIPGLCAQIYSVAGLAMGINYGAEKVRFPSTVPVNTRVRAGAELAGVSRTGNQAKVTVRVTVECEGAAKPACVAETVSILVAA
ncbi:MaoC family dehydratase [Jatrophihabitans sp.]|uniref:MaoC family dehydratase n=1 Tax=Jatrophihabitans sp. TaxID=1932789 RepID=UPI0030C6BA73